ncbi:MAG: translation initiation factor IF-2 subunit beta [Methanospirillaceae archaeon]|nr:translation initiation factor IF-2 subunit beta [Methanospirillaceae archaeon]
MDESYESLLHKAYEQVTEPTEETSRWTYPEPRVTIEGKTTILDNFTDIVSAFRRDPDHLMKYILGELGTAGKLDGNRAIFNGKFEESLINAIITSYVSDYITCSECGKPDTHLVKEGRVQILMCDACGSHRPVRKRKARSEPVGANLEVGAIIEVTIENLSRRGDGVAKIGKNIVYVSKSKPGQTLKVKIVRISGSIIFTERP